MNPSKVERDRVKSLTDLPNIGKAMADDLELLGIRKPEQLIGLCPFEMHKKLCKKMGNQIDPCVIDVFISITRFMNGEEPRPWWKFTKERKRLLEKGGKK